MKSLKYKTIFFVSFILMALPALIVHADNTTVTSNFNFETIYIPLFLPFNAEFAKSATIFSWISFIGIIATVALVVFWIYLILRTAVKAMQSRGESEGLEDVSKRFRSIFTGIFITFLVPLVLSVIGVLLGIGTIFTWPKMFSKCETVSGDPVVSVDGAQTYAYYFQAYLAADPAKNPDRQGYADALCGLTTSTVDPGKL